MHCEKCSTNTILSYSSLWVSEFLPTVSLLFVVCTLCAREGLCSLAALVLAGAVCTNCRVNLEATGRLAARPWSFSTSDPTSGAFSRLELPCPVAFGLTLQVIMTWMILNLHSLHFNVSPRLMWLDEKVSFCWFFSSLFGPVKFILHITVVINHRDLLRISASNSHRAFEGNSVGSVTGDQLGLRFKEKGPRGWRQQNLAEAKQATI